jgi:hypothetical protein
VQYSLFDSFLNLVCALVANLGGESFSIFIFKYGLDVCIKWVGASETLAALGLIVVHSYLFIVAGWLVATASTIGASPPYCPTHLERFFWVASRITFIDTVARCQGLALLISYQAWAVGNLLSSNYQMPFSFIM